MEKSVRNAWDKLFKRQKNAPEGWLKRNEWIEHLNIGASTFDERIKDLRALKEVKIQKYIDETGHKRMYIWINKISPFIKKKLPKCKSNT